MSLPAVSISIFTLTYKNVLTFNLILCSTLGYVNEMIRFLDRMVNLQFQPFFEEHERLAIYIRKQFLTFPL